MVRDGIEAENGEARDVGGREGEEGKRVDGGGVEDVLGEEDSNCSMKET